MHLAQAQGTPALSSRLGCPALDRVAGHVLVVAFKDSAAVEKAVTFAVQNVIRAGDAMTLLFVQVLESQ